MRSRICGWRHSYDEYIYNCHGTHWQLHLQLPTTIVVVLAYLTGKQFTLPIYDIYVRDKKIPFLLPLPSYDKLTPASTIMRPLKHADAAADWIESNFTHADGLLLLERSDAHVFPVVESREKPLLLGVAHRSALEKAVEVCEDVSMSRENAKPGKTPIMRTKDTILSMTKTLLSPFRKTRCHGASSEL